MGRIEPMKIKKRRTIKAWAIVNNDTGRLMLIDVSIGGMMPARMYAAAIYMTRAAAMYNKSHDERVVRITIEEVSA
jgi:hypothetical protein